VLIANKKFQIEGQWHTWIDYPKFHQLIGRYYETDGKESFTSEDYMAPTPDWSLYNAKEGGFSPNEIRFKRTRNHLEGTVRPEMGVSTAKNA
jgi:tRNA wybutosine-synthesizing protein 1